MNKIIIKEEFFWRQCNNQGWESVSDVARVTGLTTTTIYNKLEGGWRLLELRGLASLWDIGFDGLMQRGVDK